MVLEMIVLTVKMSLIKMKFMMSMVIKMILLMTMMLTMIMSKKRLMLKMMMSVWTRVGADEPCYFRNLVTRNRPATQLN